MKIFTSLSALGSALLFGGVVLSMAVSSQNASGDPLLAAQDEDTPPSDTDDGKQPGGQQTQANEQNSPQSRQQRQAERTQAARKAAGLLQRCRRLLDGRTPGDINGKRVTIKSYRANIVERIRFGEHTFAASGTYVQAPQLKRRLELTIRHGMGRERSVDTLLQVCDGDIVRTLQMIDGKPRLTRRNIREILRVAGATDENQQIQIITALGIGGISGLIASLQNSMEFDAYNQTDTGSIEILGTWAAPYRAQFAQRARNGRLPAHVPDRVRVVVDANYLLRKIEYLKSRGGSEDEDEDELRPMMTIFFRNIEVNPPDITAETFQFTAPKEAYPKDVTGDYTQRIQNARNRPQ